MAVAVLREPELPRLLRGLVMMAGSYRSPGNTAPTTEWNVAVDPEAMQVVLRAFGPDGAGRRRGPCPARSASTSPSAPSSSRTTSSALRPSAARRPATHAG